ncbi:SRPBCC family protein [Gordonia sp. SID5947]|uniref:SRPBCC family protein n=1 Tax=Gordonia sp. SID5947 TaxID=2690315 RepID=UPI00136C4F64|nr:SRPBCC family protein [Gordonia sp. SID5947]MYR08933.1 SRPBCC family protein [Gordonia sp. SID5947]
METVTAERTIDAPVPMVFDWMSNAHNYTRARWVVTERLVTPGVEAPYGTGAVRVLWWTVGRFAERITSYRPPHSFDYDVYRSFPPSRHEFGRVSCRDVDGATHITWTTTFELAIPVIGAAMTRLVARPIMRRAFERILDSAVDDLRSAAADDSSAQRQ